MAEEKALTAMTPEETEIGKAFSRITFLPGSYDKRFCKTVHWMAAAVNAGVDSKNLLTDKQHELIYTMLHRYRRQIPDIHEKFCKECKVEYAPNNPRFDRPF